MNKKESRPKTPATGKTPSLAALALGVLAVLAAVIWLAGLFVHLPKGLEHLGGYAVALAVLAVTLELSARLSKHRR